MEDAAKRRERLMALRTEASQSSGAPPPVPPSLGGLELPDPLFSSSSPAEAPSQPPRFDYYTNPSAAFSSSHNLNKRKSSSFHSSPASRPHARPNVRPNYAGLNQPPMHQLGPQFHTPPHAPPTMHWRSAAQFQTPSAGNIHPPTSGHGSWQYASGPPHMPYSNRPFVRDSSSGPRPRPNYNYLNSSSGTRGTGGRGVGFRSQFGHSSYYSKSMVEDPWIELEPIVGKLVDSHDASGSGSGSWLPESIRKKESKKPEIGNKYGKKLSLSEYLDLSFNQTIDET
ncbi:hypothetical protein LUZ61_003676 [Rhynchospora tenuis]|uniref:Uncharacterized protein n=1 Tax=Rhynchospora tenuis TaxID=198213 RepID=A0AAD6ET04_9POAL|nr:hypothetical protein LUZ61_003676 [Rhynchospora tenuis]